MTLVILTILVLAYVLIATENVTKVNRAAVAIFAGTVGWVLFVCFGMDFVTSEHMADYSRFLHLGDADSTSTTVKYYSQQQGLLRLRKTAVAHPQQQEDAMDARHRYFPDFNQPR